MSCQHEHSHGNDHGHDDSDHVLPIPTNASQNLRNQIDFNKLSGLNIEQHNDDLYKVFNKYEQTRYQVSDYIQSDADEQMILNIPFLNSSVKLYSIILRTSAGETCPKTIRIFKNRTDLDFGTVEDLKPDFILNNPNVGVEGEATIDRNESSFVEHFLPRQKFTNITQISLFVKDVYGEDEDISRIYYVELRGEFKLLSKDPIITLYEAAANPADHKSMVGQDIQNHSQIG